MYFRTRISSCEVRTNLCLQFVTCRKFCLYWSNALRILPEKKLQKYVLLLISSDDMILKIVLSVSSFYLFGMVLYLHTTLVHLWRSSTKALPLLFINSTGILSVPGDSLLVRVFMIFSLLMVDPVFYYYLLLLLHSSSVVRCLLYCSKVLNPSVFCLWN